jgi:hypothetical protein
MAIFRHRREFKYPRSKTAWVTKTAEKKICLGGLSFALIESMVTGSAGYLSAVFRGLLLADMNEYISKVGGNL